MIINMVALVAVMIYAFALGYNWKAMRNWKRDKRKRVQTDFQFDLNNPMNIHAIANQRRKVD